MIENALEKLEDVDDDLDENSDSDDIWHMKYALGDIEGAIDDVKKSLQDFTAFIKTFDKSEFGTIYCEREWRSTEEYKFDFDDIAMIALPKAVDGKNYFLDFVEDIAPKLKIPRRIPMVPWDDLVEH